MVRELDGEVETVITAFRRAQPEGRFVVFGDHGMLDVERTLSALPRIRRVARGAGLRLGRDFEVWLERLAPEEPHSQYRHNGYEDNADAHLKRSVMGREVVVAVTDGKLDFGPWEQIFYGEFDGKRRKRVLVKIIGE